MVAFLTCLQEMGDFADQKSHIKLPYPISNDKIGEYSIVLQSNSNEEQWTLALKNMLVNMNHLLAWLSKRPV